jgi:hypothetical protein
MYKAIKDNKIIAINETGEFPCLVYDLIEEDSHELADYVHVNGEFVLTSDDKAIQQAKQERIAELKQLLADSDYWGQKYLDGEYTEEEWEAKKAQRKAWREEIRGLE